MWKLTGEPLWQHQKHIRDYGRSILMSKGGLWVQAGCTTGKTYASIALAHSLGVSHFLVIAPLAATNDAWGNCVRGKTEGLECVVLDKGSTAQKGILLKRFRRSEHPVCVVINYESAMYCADAIAEANYPLVIADESHRLQSHNGSTSQKLAEACRGARYRIALTGTPYEDRPLSVYGQVRWLFPGPKPQRKSHIMSTPIFGRWMEFFVRYMNFYTLNNKPIPTTPKNLDELGRKIAPFTIIVNTEDVVDLPPEMHIERVVHLTPKTRKLYNELKREFYAELEEAGHELDAQNVLVLAGMLQRLTSGFYTPKGSKQPTTLDEVPPKIRVVQDFLEEVGGLPVVIFTKYVEEVRMLKEYLSEYECKVLVGGQHEHEEWSKGAGQVLIANYAAGSAGVDLTRARYAIFYSGTYSRTEYTQALWRVRRANSDKRYPVTYLHIIAENTIDRAIQQAIKSKGDVARQLLASSQLR